jgi:mannan endo-1,4-beta-mannosidase
LQLNERPGRQKAVVFCGQLLYKPLFQDAGENSTGTSLRAWVDEMAAYIKSLDPNHMVGIGIEGHQAKYGFGGDEGNPFVYLHQSPSIDYTTAHPYPDEAWANLSVAQTRTLLEAWISDSHNVVGKPFIMGEWNVHNNKDQYWPAMLDEIEHHNCAGSLFWNYNDYSTSDFDMLTGNSIVATYFKPHSARMAAKSGVVVTQPVTPTPTRSVTPTPTRVITATPTPTARVTSTPTRRVTPTLRVTPTGRFTPTPTRRGATATPTRSATPTPTRVNTPTPTNQVPLGYAVSYVIQSEWGNGATISVTIINNGASVVNGWTLAFTFPGNQTITNLWNGTYTQSGAAVSVKDAGYNANIPVNGGSVNFGFNLNYSGSNAKPTAFMLNGTACLVQ